MSDDDVATVGTTVAAPAPSSHEPPERDITDGGPDMVQFLAADGTRVPVTEVNAPYAAYLDELGVPAESPLRASLGAMA